MEHVQRTLADDVTLSRYRIEGLLGAGGMGEVYKAWDATLERSVALKVLPPSLVQNSDRLRRFIQEAKAASSLNHPNIVTIHDAGAERDLQYITMELIDGETLRERINAGAPLRSLIGWLAQAADGLAKAHAAGIVHRDLKPDNIMITRDGYAKVLDFGLAKLVEPGAASNAAEQVTQVRKDEVTREGFVVGTIGYMSPEQVLAKPVDHRSDVFSFGAILYEAATRRRPFIADSDVDLMHKIVHEQPEPVDRLNPATPAELRRLIRRCLAKDPDQRIQSMKDLAIDLHEIHDEFDLLRTQSDSHSQPTVIVPGIVRRRPRRAVIGAAVVVLLMVSAGIALWRMRSHHAEARFTLEKLKIRKLTIDGNVRRAAISPDGKYLAYEADDDGKFSLRLRQVATGSDLQTIVPHEEEFMGVSFSPDSNYLYFAARETAKSEYSMLQSMPALGGPARKLVFDADSGVTFSPDGKRIAFIRGVPEKLQSQLIVGDSDGGNATALFVGHDDDLLDFYTPSWSPDGKRIAATTGWGTKTRRILLIDVDSKKAIQLGDLWNDISSVAWMPDGSGVVVTGAPKESGAMSQIWFVSYPDGHRSRIYSDLNDYVGVMPTADGKALAAVQINRKTNLIVSSPDGSNPKGLSGPDPLIDAIAVGGDGVIFSVTTAGGSRLWTLEPNGTRTQLTKIDSTYPSTEGRTILFMSAAEGHPHIFAIDIDGNNVRQLTNGGGEWFPSIAPDGSWFCYTMDGNLMRQPLRAGSSPSVIAKNVLGPGKISPDGKSVAVMTWSRDASGKSTIDLRDLPLAGQKSRGSIPWLAERGWDWTASGEIAYFNDNARRTLWVASFAGGAPRKLAEYPDAGYSAFAFSPDGKQLYASRTQKSQDAVLLTDFR